MGAKTPKKAIIIAGGKGTRLYPVTLETPKPLLSVKKKPILNYLIELFREHGVTDIKVVIREADYEDFSWWRKRFEAGLGNISISFDIEPEPMGTLGYVFHNLKEWIGKEPVFVTNADEVKRVDLKKLFEFHKTNGGLATVALVSVENPSDYGVAVMKGPKIATFLEKPKDPPTSFVSSGLYVVSPEALLHVPTQEKFLMIERDLFPHLASRGLLTGFKGEGFFFDCGTFERWNKAIKHFSEGEQHQQ